MRKTFAPFLILLIVPALAVAWVSSDGWRGSTLRRIETVAGRPVWFDAFALRWRNGIGLALKEVTVYSRDQSGVQMQVDEITAVPNPASLLKKKVELSSVSIKKRQGALVRDSKGNLSFTGPRNPSSESIPVRALDLMLKDVSGRSPAPVSGTLAVFSYVPNLKLSGVWDPARPNELSDARIELDLSKIDLAELAIYYPKLSSLGLQSIEGTVVIEAERLVPDRRRAFDAPLRVEWTGGEIRSSHLATPLAGITVELRAHENTVSSWTASASFAEGRLSASGVVDPIIPHPHTHFEASAEAIALDKMFVLPKDLSGRIRGTAAGQFRGQMTGLAPISWLYSLKGSGQVRAERVQAAGINVVRQLCEALSLSLPEDLRVRYAAQDTEFTALTAELSVGPQGILSEDVRLEAEAFTAEGVGRLDRGGRLSAEMKVRIDRALAAEWTRSDPEVERYVNAQNLLEIPVTASGPLNALRLDTSGAPLPSLSAEALSALRERT